VREPTARQEEIAFEETDDIESAFESGTALKRKCMPPGNETNF